jgi:hypothetical protein
MKRRLYGKSNLEHIMTAPKLYGIILLRDDVGCFILVPIGFVVLKMACRSFQNARAENVMRSRPTKT